MPIEVKQVPYKNGSFELIIQNREVNQIWKVTPRVNKGRKGNAFFKSVSVASNADFIDISDKEESMHYELLGKYFNELSEQAINRIFPRESQFWDMVFPFAERKKNIQRIEIMREQFNNKDLFYTALGQVGEKLKSIQTERLAKFLRDYDEGDPDNTDNTERERSNGLFKSLTLDGSNIISKLKKLVIDKRNNNELEICMWEFQKIISEEKFNQENQNAVSSSGTKKLIAKIENEFLKPFKERIEQKRKDLVLGYFKRDNDFFVLSCLDNQISLYQQEKPPRYAEEISSVNDFVRILANRKESIEINEIVHLMNTKVNETQTLYSSLVSDENEFENLFSERVANQKASEEKISSLKSAINTRKNFAIQIALKNLLQVSKMTDEEKELSITTNELRNILNKYAPKRNPGFWSNRKREGSTTIKNLRLLLVVHEKNPSISLEELRKAIHRKSVGSAHKNATNYIIHQIINLLNEKQKELKNNLVVTPPISHSTSRGSFS